MTSTPVDRPLAVAFLGYPVTQRRAADDPLLSLADNRMQHGYLHALTSAYGVVHAVSSVPADPGQHGPVTTNGLTWRHVSPSAPGPLGGLLKVLALYRDLAAWARATPGNRVLVYYNTFLLYGLVGWALRVRYGVAVVPIAITLPYRTPDQEMSLPGRIQGRVADRLLRRVDGLVAISPFLGDALAPGVDTCVVRGGVPDDSLPATPARREASDRPRHIVYAGNLTPRYHLLTAVEMMAHLPEAEYELHLYGRGALESELREAARRTPSIHLHGVIDESAVAGVLAEADVLLALLRTDDHLARYSFPSKLFESLASGVPTLTTDLPTLDETMKEHLVVLERVEPAELARTVVAVTSRSESEQQGAARAALGYLHDNATWSAVGVRLHDFLAHLEKWST